MRKHGLRYAGILMVIVLAVCGCGADGLSAQKNDPYTVSFFAMDTYMELKVYGKNGKEAAEAAKAEIVRLDELLSTGDENSEVARLNNAGTDSALEVSEDTAALIRKSLELFESTEGAFDITVYPLMSLWGFTSGEYWVPAAEEVSEALKLVDSGQAYFDEEAQSVRLGPGQQIDFGGIAKGYASDRVAEILTEYGVKSAWISLGGNIHAMGYKTDGSRWRIGIRDPKGTAADYLAVVSVADKAVVTSGNYERYFTDEETGETYHHIIDPESGCPARNGVASVTIICDNGMLADGLSTSLFIMGLEKGCDYWRMHSDEFQAVFVMEDGGIYVTEGLLDSFACEREYEVIEERNEH